MNGVSWLWLFCLLGGGGGTELLCCSWNCCKDAFLHKTFAMCNYICTTVFPMENASWFHVGIIVFEMLTHPLSASLQHMLNDESIRIKTVKHDFHNCLILSLSGYHQGRHFFLWFLYIENYYLSFAFILALILGHKKSGKKEDTETYLGFKRPQLHLTRTLRAINHDRQCAKGN